MDGWRMMMVMNFAASAFHSPLMSGLLGGMDEGIERRGYGKKGGVCSSK
jgi:hypothetical protein